MLTKCDRLVGLVVKDIAIGAGIIVLIRFESAPVMNRVNDMMTL